MLLPPTTIKMPEPTMPTSRPAPANGQLLPYSAATYRLAFGIPGDSIKVNHTWGVPPDAWKVEALAARAARRPWRPAEPPPQPARTYHAAVRRLLQSEEARHLGGGDPALQLKYARQVADHHAFRRAAVLDAEKRLTAAVGDGELPAFGVKVDTPNATQWCGPYVPILPGVLALPGCIIRVNGALCAEGAGLDDFGPLNCGPYFCDVFVDSNALRRLHPPLQVPDVSHVPVWDAITWRAFGRAGSRNLGSRPESLREPRLDCFENWEEHALRLGGWAAILAAEAELKALLLSGRVTAYGRREGTDADGQPTYKLTGPHVAIPAEIFLSDRWTFEPTGCMHEFPWNRVTTMNGKRTQRELWFFDVQIAWPELALAWGTDVLRETLDNENRPVLTPQPFPTAGLIAPWVAASWRAFGTLDTPGHIISHRSFDGGTSQLPDESDAAYAIRQEEHRRFDAAEREVMDMLANRHSKAIGKPPAVKDGRQFSHAAARTYIDIPAITFLSRELAFAPCGGLVSRLSVLEREFDNQKLHGSDADPRFPLYYDVLIEAAGLRKVWDTLVDPAIPSAAETTSAAEKRFTAWLIRRIKSAPNNPPGKPAVRIEANTAGFNISGRAFIRAWAKAVQEANAPAWSSSGRKSKRRIETPT